MSEKKLTVAELMARAAEQKTGEDGSAPRKRRRRSLEEGGVSVAELTGSLPAVKDKPSDSRHTAQPIDDEDGATRISASELAARRTGAAPVTGPTDAEPQQGAHEAPHVSTHAADDDEDLQPEPGSDAFAAAAAPTAGHQADNAVDEDKTPDADSADTAGEDTAGKVVSGSEPTNDDASDSPVDTDSAAAVEQQADTSAVSTPSTTGQTSDTGDQQPQQAEPSALEKAAAAAKAQRAYADGDSHDGNTPAAGDTDEKTTVEKSAGAAGLKLNVVDEKDPVQLTTGSFPAVTGTETTDDTTGEQTPQANKDTGADEKADTSAAADTDTTAGTEDTQDAAVSDAEPEETHSGSDEADKEAADTTATATADKQDTDPVEEAMSPETDDKAAVATTGDTDVDTTDDDDDDRAEGKKRSTMSVVIMVIVALVLAVVIFKGFEVLWLSSLNVWIKAILAFAVTLGCVGGVHALRTERDTVSMGLAALAGLAVTFGPLAVVAM